jgi:hypothetical protein
LGPSGAFGAEDSPGAPASPEEYDAGADTPNAVATDASDTVAADTPEGTVAARARTPASNGQGRLYATRSVEPSRVRPGQEFTVTVSFPAVAGRVVLDETAPGTDARIDDATPEPVRAVATEGGVYAMWDLDSETAASVTYTVTAPTEATDGQTLPLQGEALFPDHEIDVAGTELVVVTTDVLGDILWNGHEVSARDLADVSAHLEAGVVTDEEFERVYHAWLDEHASSTADARVSED